MQVESIKGTIQSVTADLVGNVVLYDEDFFPDDRKAFIRNWILEEETVALVIVDNEYSSKVLGNNHKNITCRILLLNGVFLTSYYDFIFSGIRVQGYVLQYFEQSVSVR